MLDSRANGLQERVDVLNVGEYLGIRQYNGATLHDLTRQASRHLDKYPFDVVYIAGGICDVTTKDDVTKTISFRWNPPNDVSKHLLNTLNRENETMRKDHPAARVVFCPLVGADLKRVVNGHAVTEAQQEAVNEAIFEFNNKIFAVNKARGTHSPSLHRTVHRSSKGTHKSHYHHLEDGIHLTDTLKDNWAAAFVKATTNN